jgi:hypothetical protein
MGLSLYLIFNKKDKSKTNQRLFILINIFIFYLFLGAYIHLLLNKNEFDRQSNDLLKLKTNFYTKHNCASIKEIDELVDDYVYLSNKGIDISLNSTHWKVNGDTLFFTFTLLSTIGYGNLNPISFYGKLFCIVYISFGVPINIFLFTLLVKLIRNKIDEKMFKKSSATVKRSYGTIQNELSYANKLHKSLIIKTVVIFMILFLFIYMLPAYLISYYFEQWSLLDSIYYLFISISKIGLGDYVPMYGQEGIQRNLYRAGLTGK